MPYFRFMLLTGFVLLSGSHMACHRFLLEEDGFRHVRVGESFSLVSGTNSRGVKGKDTVFAEQGYEWRGVIWETNRGPVVIEESFFGDSMINRIRIESSKFRTPTGIRVGDQIGSFKDMADDWVLTPIANYQRLDLYSSRLGGYHFLVELPEGISEQQINMDHLADSLPVLGIVVM